jgi:hypothetical protein
MTGPEPVAVRVVRRWARVYTRGLPVDDRERRRLELESAVWEHLHDPDEVATGRAVFGRFLRGIPADVRWRYRTLLDSRGARHRSNDMTTTPRFQWWTPTTIVIGVTITVLALLGLGFGESESGGWIVALSWLIAAVVLLAGLAALRWRPVVGTWTVITGAVLFALAEPLATPLSIVVILGGLWTGNLVTSRHKAEATIPLAPQQSSLVNRWYLWLTVAAALGAIGFIVLLVWPAVTPDTCTEVNPCWQDSAAWAAWILSWMAALVTGGIGVILGGLRLLVRHRTRFA